MGIKERKAREKLKMRKIILDTAIALFNKNGIDHISIRNIAGTIEYSPATIYLYFNDKEEILSQMKDIFIDEFYNKLKEFSFMKDHYGRLKNYALTWLEYAINNPDKYKMIFRTNGFLKDDRIFQYICATVLQCQHENVIRRMPQEEATTMFMAFLHGISSLALNNKFDFNNKTELRDFIGALINRQINSMKQPSSI